MAHVHAKTALTEPVRHQVRQQSGSGEGSGQGTARSPRRSKVPMLMVRTRVSTVPVSCATTLGLDQSNRLQGLKIGRSAVSTPTDARAHEAGAVQHGSTATSPDSRQPARPPAHQASWDDGQTSRGAASSGRRGLPLARRGQNRRGEVDPRARCRCCHQPVSRRSPPAPGVHLSMHRALRVSCPLVSRWWRLLVPGSMGSGYCCRGSGSVSPRRWMRR